MGRRRGAAAALLGAVALLCGLALPAQAAWRGELRAATFNIHAGIGADGRLDLDRTARAIGALGADVVALQEVDSRWGPRSGYADEPAELARRTGMHAFFAPIYDLPPEPGRAEPRRYGTAILSRLPILRTRNHPLTRLSTLEPGAAPRPAPGFAEADVATPAGPVRAYSTHLDFRPDPAIRSRQVEETLAILRAARGPAPQVLMGDLNAPPSAPELGPLLRAMRDAWAAARGPGGGLTYPAEAPRARIDYVTVSPGLRAEDADVPDTTASDHRPLVATLSRG